uniref:Uncharacterized protein n=1 Tax=Gasterosteus aculeatus TaxID=69293 RepID=G3PSZ4_GASAC
SASTPSCISACATCCERGSTAASRRSRCVPCTRTSTPSTAGISSSADAERRRDGVMLTNNNNNNNRQYGQLVLYTLKQTKAVTR